MAEGLTTRRILSFLPRAIFCLDAPVQDTARLATWADIDRHCRGSKGCLRCSSRANEGVPEYGSTDWMADGPTSAQALCCLSDNLDMLVQAKLVENERLGTRAWQQETPRPGCVLAARGLSRPASPFWKSGRISLKSRRGETGPTRCLTLVARRGYRQTPGAVRVLRVAVKPRA